MLVRITAVAAAIALSAPAFAADLVGPVSGGYKDVPYVAPYSWTGFYAGVEGGYANGGWKGDMTYNGANDPIFTSNKKIDADGGFGGGQIGYNRQYGSIVLGGEADISGSSLEGKSTFHSTTVNPLNPSQSAFDKTIDSQLEYFGTVRGRIGYSMGNFLPYVTGGLAWGHTHSNLTVNNNYLLSLGILSGPSGTGSVSEDHVGWTVGSGVEWAIDPRWSLKAEYLYTDLGSESYRYSGAIAAGIGGGAFKTDGYNSSLTFSSVKVGLNYHVGQVYEPLK